MTLVQLQSWVAIHIVTQLLSNINFIFANFGSWIISKAFGAMQHLIFDIPIGQGILKVKVTTQGIINIPSKSLRFFFDRIVWDP